MDLVAGVDVDDTATRYEQAVISLRATGARVAGYYEPNAILREFAAVFLRYRVVNLGICAVLVIVPLGTAAVHLMLRG